MSSCWHCFFRRSVGRVACLLACLAVAPLVERPVAAAIIYVEGSCSLVDAIQAANSDSPTGGCIAGLGHDTVKLSADVVLSAAHLAGVGLPVIISPITIEGGGWAIERAGGPVDFRIFQISFDGDLTLRQVTVGNGRVTGDASQTADGGCIRNFGVLELVDSTVSGCQVVADGNLSRGAGIYNSGTLVVTNSTIRLNGASSVGSDAFGGGMFGSNGSTLTITNSTISGNYAIGTTGLGVGGGLHSGFAASALITSVTFSGNSADDGAALRASGATTVRGSIFGNSVFSENCGASPVDGGENLADDDSCATIPDTLSGLDHVLRDNGGPTMTHALLAGSSAILSAPTCGLPNDQRGAPRGRFCDSGAFEFGGCPEIVLSDDTVLSAKTYESCQFQVGPNYCVVGPFGDLTLRAGREVSFSDGFCVQLDARLTVALDPDLIP